MSELQEARTELAKALDAMTLYRLSGSKTGTREHRLLNMRVSAAQKRVDYLRMRP